MRKYDQEFKDEVLRRIKDGQSVSSLARELGVSETLVYRWKQKAASESPESNDEIVRLRKRMRELEMENEILKKAALIFGRGS
jgi:transposase